MRLKDVAGLARKFNAHTIFFSSDGYEYFVQDLNESIFLNINIFTTPSDIMLYLKGEGREIFDSIEKQIMMERVNPSKKSRRADSSQPLDKSSMMTIEGPRESLSIPSKLVEKPPDMTKNQSNDVAVAVELVPEIQAVKAIQSNDVAQSDMRPKEIQSKEKRLKSVNSSSDLESHISVPDRNKPVQKRPKIDEKATSISTESSANDKNREPEMDDTPSKRGRGRSAMVEMDIMDFLTLKDVNEEVRVSCPREGLANPSIMLIAFVMGL